MVYVIAIANEMELLIGIIWNIEVIVLTKNITKINRMPIIEICYNLDHH